MNHHTCLKWLALAASVLSFSSIAEAQAIRFDSFSYTTSSACAPGKQCQVLALPGTKVNVCQGSAASLSACLSSPGVTYTSTGAGTTCSTTSQLTPATGGACLSTSDNQGNFGFWVLPGSYSYYLQVPATAGGGTYGPYPFSVHGDSGGYTFDANYATLQLACAAAGSGTLAITKRWDGTPSQTLSCNLWFLGGGIIQPASGQLVNISGSVDGAAIQHFDYSAGGTVTLTGATGIIYPEWWGTSVAALGYGCTAAGSRTITIDRAWNALTTTAYGCSMAFLGTGSLGVTASNTVTISGTINAPQGLTIFAADGSASGSVLITGKVPVVSASWWGTSNAANLRQASLAASGNSNGSTLLISTAFTALTNSTVAALVSFAPGGSLQPSSGQTVNVTIQSAPLTTICDISLTGVCSITSLNGIIYPEWFGARADGTTASKPGIDAAILQPSKFNAPIGPAGIVVQLQSGKYQYNGTMTGLSFQTTGAKLMGTGSETTYINFTDSTVTAGIYWPGPGGFANLTISGLTVNGPGKTTGTNVHGIYYPFRSESYGLKLHDVRASNWSGAGIYIAGVFDMHIEDTWVEHIGGGGPGACLIIGGDQSTTFINSGQFNDDCGNNTGNATGNADAFSWWFIGGAPFLQGLNTSDTAQGIRFGSTSGDPTGIQFCTPTIIGINIEGVERVGGTGMLFENGSNARFAAGIQIYAINVAAGKGVWWKTAMNNSGLFVPAPGVNGGSGMGTWDNRFYCDGAGFPNHGVTLFIGDDQTSDLSSGCTDNALIAQIIPSTPSGGGPLGFTVATQLLAPGLNNTGGHYVTNTRTVTAATDTVVSTDVVLFMDATSNVITETIPAANAFATGTTLTFKKIDSTANQVSLSNGLIDGASGYTLYTPNQQVTMVTNGSGWQIIDEKNIGWFNPRDVGNGTVAGLPACTAFFSPATLAPQVTIDSNTNTLGAVVAGGGSFRLLATCNVYTQHWVVMQNWNN